MKKYILGLVFLLVGFSAKCEIWLPSILSDNMVLQQNSKAMIWGWSTQTTEKIVVTGSWDNKPVETVAHQGKWSLELPTPSYGGPYIISIKGHQEIILENILIGEVWLCSGQSNMQWSANNGFDNAEEEVKAANYPNIRFFTVPRHGASTLQENTPGQWSVCTPETMRDFSAVGYFFGRELNQKMEIPIGLINSSWGGTPVEIWTPGETVKDPKFLKEASLKIAENSWYDRSPGFAYNAMIHPLAPFTLAGYLWYQGESNRQNADYYYKTFPMLIESWRREWGNPNLPFYYVQIAPFDYENNDSEDIEAAIVRDAQLKTMDVLDHTGMVVTNDIGNLKNIHPGNKQEVGRRLALWALAKTYGVSDIDPSGPTFKSMEIRKNKALVTFEHTGGELQADGKELKEFYIAGEDRQFYPAKAKIKGDMVELSSKEVKKPVAVRFAFSDIALPNLFGKNGLPAAAFRTDAWEVE
ncbi:sialate O-acetylesterase [Echinicola shivajiensis]|uniref:sialate O-acetylesterase n=1 Tax=Echinicola shivajiensis TaxID=1035916 RepID=UPI001BFC7511|nr:sialate O-acetylesterase [Echinicola shivajiensis]